MITSRSLPEKFRAVFSDGEHECHTDTVAQYGGAGAGFKPVELMEASLAACIQTVVRIAADKRGIPLEGVAVTATLDTSSAAETVFTYKVELAGQLTDEQRETLMRAAGGCPVKKALSKPVVFRQAE